MNNTLGDKIKHLLFLRSMKQADLVKVSGVSKATISELINNKQKNPSIETIEKIAKALRVSPLYFLEENAVTPLEVAPHLPQHIREFILNSENMDYIVLAHKLKSKNLPVEVMEKIIESYESLIQNKKYANS
ncbi:transcriptional regulator, XRE family [Thermincola ferriacetica]|uniref:Transcriptional regulator, XRE family n=2 Tax=Thermincola TaxID=278993 RepID=D5XBY9_THEPJ|nr:MULTISPECIES: helix-turn-helix transcriptional regulator [Thermincola]ADG81537.1 transcriptional regulator, XRE family [Thermincola potens JR]KNZ69829.1 transcriptional regulator, XRE family [Thermincola ferriacetica]